MFAAFVLSLFLFVIGLFAAVFSQGCGALCSQPDEPGWIPFLIVLIIWALAQYAIYCGTRVVLRRLEILMDRRCANWSRSDEASS
jgi:uncharacterized membrane protein